jgi:hypothetical protein
VSLSDVPLPASEVNAKTAKITHAMQKKTILVLDCLITFFSFRSFNVSRPPTEWQFELNPPLKDSAQVL